MNKLRVFPIAGALGATMEGIDLAGAGPGFPALQELVQSGRLHRLQCGPQSGCFIAYL